MATVLWFIIVMQTVIITYLVWRLNKAKKQIRKMVMMTSKLSGIPFPLDLGGKYDPTQ